MIHYAVGIHAAKEALHEFRLIPQVKPSNDSLIQLLEFVLTKNNFTFTREHYLQVGGTSMGTTTPEALLLIWPPEWTHKSTSHSPWISLPNHWGENAHTPNASFVLCWITPSMHYYIHCVSLQVQHHLQELKFGVLHHLQDLQKAICVTNQKLYSTKIQLPFLLHQTQETTWCSGTPLFTNRP